MEEKKTKIDEIEIKEKDKYNTRIPVSMEKETVIIIEQSNERNS
jgi:hypothetical protein